jgi:predicted P-loop ATPase
MGDQGSQKSSFWAALGGPFFSDALKDISNKDDLMVLHSSWIMEWSEIDALNSKKHAGAVKAFLSQSTDLFRVPYGKSTERFPRRGIIVASTNREEGFLIDDTGNRRFWVIPVTCTLDNPVDISNVLLERDSIWSAAVAAYKAGYPTYLTNDLEAQVAEQNDSFVASNPWQVLIENWLASPASNGTTITTELILTDVIKMDPPQQNQYHQKQVGVILRRLGFLRKKARIKGNVRWIYQLPCSP